MTTDDDMREIEAALDEFVYVHECEGKKRGPLLALIRQKLEGNVAQKPAPSAQPAADVAQNDAGSVVSKGGPVHSVIITVDGKVTRFTPVTDDAEHEREVEAWRAKAESSDLTSGEIDEALRLMRARPAKGKDSP